MLARLTCRAAHMYGAEESSWNASARPARSTDAEMSFGTSAHGLPAQTDAEISFGTPVHGLPAFTDGVVFQRQPRPARLLCPPLAIVSVFHMFAWLTCRRGSHVSDAELSFGTSVHGLPASTDAEFSERQRTACPHYDSIISCGVSHTVWFVILLVSDLLKRHTHRILVPPEVSSVVVNPA